MTEEARIYAWSWTRSVVIFIGGIAFVLLAVAPLSYWLSLGITPTGWIGLALYESLFLGCGLWMILVRGSLEIRPAARRVIKVWRVLGIPVSRGNWSFEEFQSVLITISQAVTHTQAGNIKSRTANVMLRRRDERNPILVHGFLMAPFSDEIPPDARAAAADVARLIGIPVTTTTK